MNNKKSFSFDDLDIKHTIQNVSPDRSLIYMGSFLTCDIIVDWKNGLVYGCASSNTEHITLDNIKNYCVEAVTTKTMKFNHPVECAQCIEYGWFDDLFKVVVRKIMGEFILQITQSDPMITTILRYFKVRYEDNAMYFVDMYENQVLMLSSQIGADEALKIKDMIHNNLKMLSEYE